MSQYVTCEVDGYSLCIPIAAVQEIHRIREITPVQRSPKYVSGLLNLRGHVVTMIDLGVRMGMRLRSGLGRKQNIVLKRAADLQRAGLTGPADDSEAQDEVLGLAVDAVGDVIEVDDAAIENVPANVDEGHFEFLKGVVRLEEQVYSIVNVGRVIVPECPHLA